jgi:lipooligosaccharide transport system permease protein
VAPAVKQTPVWGGFRVWQRNRDAFLRSWKVEIGGIAIEPFILLVAFGFGLGSYIGDIGDLSYAEFFAPGIIASYAMFHATFDATYGAYLRMETHHIYEAMLFTPLEPVDIVVGEVMWGATRSVISASAVLVAATVFGLVGSPLAILALPVAYLIGFVFASLAMVLTSTATTIGAMNNFFTLLLMPMFYVSGTFFPLDRLPEAVQRAAWALPLTPASALMRGLVTGEPTWWMLAWLAELAGYAVVPLIIASRLMRRRLIK